LEADVPWVSMWRHPMPDGNIRIANQGEMRPAHYDTVANEFQNVLKSRLPSFYRLAYRLLGNCEDAEDAVQDALLAAHKNLKQFRGESQMSTWLTTIVSNSARMQLRRRLRQPHQSLDETTGDDQESTLAECLPHRGPNPEDVYRCSETDRYLMQLAARLSPVLCRTFCLREIQELSIRDTSRILGVSNGTVKAQLSRARARLKKMMKRRFRQQSRARSQAAFRKQGQPAN